MKKTILLFTVCCVSGCTLFPSTSFLREAEQTCAEDTVDFVSMEDRKLRFKVDCK